MSSSDPRIQRVLQLPRTIDETNQRIRSNEADDSDIRHIRSLRLQLQRDADSWLDVEFRELSSPVYALLNSRLLDLGERITQLQTKRKEARTEGQIWSWKRGKVGARRSAKDEKKNQPAQAAAVAAYGMRRQIVNPYAEFGQGYLQQSNSGPSWTEEYGLYD